MSTTTSKLTIAQYQNLILAKIKTTYNSDKGKGFINHLINAFLDPALVIVSAGIAEPEPKCGITGKKLLSQVGMLEIVSDDDMKKTVAYITQLGYAPEEAPTGNHPVRELIENGFDGHEPLITSTGSSKYLGITGYQMLQKFAGDEIAAGNQNIINMMAFLERKNTKAKAKK